MWILKRSRGFLLDSTSQGSGEHPQSSIILRQRGVAAVMRRTLVQYQEQLQQLEAKMVSPGVSSRPLLSIWHQLFGNLVTMSISPRLGNQESICPGCPLTRRFLGLHFRSTSTVLSGHERNHLESLYRRSLLITYIMSTPFYRRQLRQESMIPSQFSPVRTKL